MGQVKVPEKIYLEKVYPDNGVLPNGLNYNQSPNDIEYICTDAFIEKAAEWLSEIENGTTITDIDKFVEDFKIAMKL